jgi:hypothetical protein
VCIPQKGIASSNLAVSANESISSPRLAGFLFRERARQAWLERANKRKKK